MKKTLKNILVCVSVIYLFVSLIYNIFTYNIARETVRNMNFIYKQNTATTNELSNENILNNFIIKSFIQCDNRNKP